MDICGKDLFSLFSPASTTRLMGLALTTPRNPTHLSQQDDPPSPSERKANPIRNQQTPFQPVDKTLSRTKRSIIKAKSTENSRQFSHPYNLRSIGFKKRTLTFGSSTTIIFDCLTETAADGGEILEEDEGIFRFEEEELNFDSNQENKPVGFRDFLVVKRNQSLSRSVLGEINVKDMDEYKDMMKDEYKTTPRPEPVFKRSKSGSLGRLGRTLKFDPTKR